MSKINPEQQLKEIHSMMEQSTRYIGLSGGSGIMAGIYALTGVYFIHKNLAQYIENYSLNYNVENLIAILWIGILVMSASLITSLILTYRKAKKANQSMFTKTAMRMLVHIGFPMAIGALFIVALVQVKIPELAAAVLLIFYGLGLINGSKYTLNDIRVLGVANVVLGLAALFFPSYGLYLWAAGFGLGHIIYGTYMWIKYEK